MIADVALVVVAVLAATLGPRLLQRSTSIERSPWVGIVLWQSLSVSAVAAVVLTTAQSSPCPSTTSLRSGWSEVK